MIRKIAAAGFAAVALASPLLLAGPAAADPGQVAGPRHEVSINNPGDPAGWLVSNGTYQPLMNGWQRCDNVCV